MADQQHRLFLGRSRGRPTHDQRLGAIMILDVNIGEAALFKFTLQIGDKLLHLVWAGGDGGDVDGIFQQFSALGMPIAGCVRSTRRRCQGQCGRCQI